MIHSYKGITPKIHPSVFLTESAQIIGDVEIEKESSVWFNAVIRGDVNYIRIGENTNIQDGCILHVRHEKYPLLLGSNITVGHGAILHACTIQDHCLIGMGAIVMDNAMVESYSLIAAGTVVLENMKVPTGSLVAGVPGKIVRQLSNDERKMIDESASNYKEYVKQYRQQM